MSAHYKLDANRHPVPATLTEWDALYEKSYQRQVARTQVTPQIAVSTVFVGLGAPFPVFFETMIFGGPDDQRQHRYGTWADAELGHMEIVEELQAGLNV